MFNKQIFDRRIVSSNGQRNLRDISLFILPKYNFCAISYLFSNQNNKIKILLRNTFLTTYVSHIHKCLTLYMCVCVIE